MNRKHFQQSCGCLLMGLMALGIVVCAGARVAQEIKKRLKAPQKIEHWHSPAPTRILPSHCR